jgi:ATP-dependent DNA helicase RecQ
MTKPSNSNSPAEVLHKIFGFSSFRDNQQDIVESIMKGKDCFVVMPTGGGKSLCYQLPAHIMKGTCIVISPLISLMKDQVDAAVDIGLRAAFMNSSLSIVDRRDVETRLRGGELDLLYISPERFSIPEFASILGSIPKSFIAIDEAHCVSEWGHDFRPDYLNLADTLAAFPDTPVSAFTATATHRVQDDIVKKLRLRSPMTVRASFNRPNLSYEVIAKNKPDDQILRYVLSHDGEPGIIYRTTRKSVESTAEMLEQNGIRSRPYHAGLSVKARAANQDAFNRDQIDVIVATIAFGMGIDKSNVRFVLHADLPKNIESYYQETGRAGRDGEPAHCLLLFGYGDIPKIRFFINAVDDYEEQQRQTRLLNTMVNYATVHACRRKVLLKYFGEDYVASAAESDSPCCDVCNDEVERVEATRDAQIVMSAIARSGQRFGIAHIVDIVFGADTARIRDRGHNQLKTYGAGSDQPKTHWRVIIDNLLAQGYIEQQEGEYPVLGLREESRRVLFDNEPVFIIKSKKVAPSRKRKSATETGDESHDELFGELRDLRKSIAQKQGVPPYIVFSDHTLHEMARYFPADESQLLEMSGVGQAKLERYGEPFLEAIQSFRERHPGVEPPSQLAQALPKLTTHIPTSKRKSGSVHNVTWDLLKQGLSIDAVAMMSKRTPSTIYGHIEKLITEGKSLDIDSLVDPAVRIEIETLLKEHGPSRLKTLVEAGGDDVTYDTVRMVRSWLNKNGTT